MKTDWGFVFELLCIGTLSIMLLYTGKYIDMQAKRVDRLELEMQSLISRKEIEAEVTWHDKE